MSGRRLVRRSSATGIPTIAIPTISNPCPSHQPRSHHARRSAAGSALASQTMPTATDEIARPTGEARRYGAPARRAARRTSSRRRARRARRGLRGSGTAGTRLGLEQRRDTEAEDEGDASREHGEERLTAAGRRSAGMTPSARIAAPTGSVAPPVNATTPFIPTRTPGVASPCRQRSAAITENALPTRTACPSCWRAPRWSARAQRRWRGPRRERRRRSGSTRRPRPSPSDEVQERDGDHGRKRGQAEHRRPWVRHP